MVVVEWLHYKSCWFMEDHIVGDILALDGHNFLSCTIELTRVCSVE